MKYLMPLRTTDYIDVVARATELGIRAPVGVALLPGNFPSAAGAAELRYHDAASSVRSAWRSIGLIDGGPYRMPRADAAEVADTSDPSIPLVIYFGSGLRSSPPGWSRSRSAWLPRCSPFAPAASAPGRSGLTL